MASSLRVEHPPSQRDVIQFRLLGSPSVEISDGALSIPRRQVRALLYYLATAMAPVPRERLAFLFWPDISEIDARRNLTRLLTHLRRALPAAHLLLSDGDRVALDPDRVATDLVAFERLSEHTDDADALQRAADLYRGPFLAGLSLPGSPEYEAWLLTQQRACELRYLDVLSELIEAHTARGAHAAAISAARRYLATDEMAEDVHRRLIALYATIGDRAAALRQFERCAAVLERELGVRPLPETRAAYERVLQSRPLPTPRAAPDLAWTTLRSLEAPLVGRDAALSMLQQALDDAEADRGRVVLVAGEPGIGKSRLLEEFATRSRDRAVVLGAAARSVERSLPYQPVAEALRTASNWEPLAAVPPVWLAEAARVLPELRDLRPDVPQPLPLEPHESRARLLEALCRLLLRLAEGARPLLLCLDDLQSADSATRDWLVHLAPRLSDRRVLVVAAYRIEARARVERLRRALTRLGERNELQLGGLDADSVAAIVRHVVPPEHTAAEMSLRLHRATGGNPFFLLETLRALVEAGPPPEDPAGGAQGPGQGAESSSDELPLPDSVREAVEARLRRLNPATRQVLEAGAILGGAFDFDLVRHVAGRGEIEAADGLEEALARQLLEPHAAGYRFHHALTRQAVEATLSPLRRHLLHRRAARTLARVEPQAAGRIARHFDLGGEAAAALRYYAEAAAGAQALYAWEEAEWIQSRMLALLERLDPDRAQVPYLTQRGEILSERAHIRYLQGRLDDRDADLADLVELAKTSGDRALQLEALVQRVRYLNLDARYEEAIEAAQDGLDLADRLGREAAASRLLAQIGFAHYFLGQPQLALTALEAALNAAGDEASPDMRGRVTHILGYVHFHLGEYERSLRYQEDAHACHRAVGDQNRVAWDGLDIGAVHLELGEVVTAHRYITEHLELARRIGAQPAEAYGLRLLGCWHLYQGDYATSLECFREARAKEAGLRSEHGMVAAELGIGLSLRSLGELDGARQALTGAVRRARAIRHRRRLIESLVALGLTEIGDNRPAAASQRLQEALAMACAGECWESVAIGGAVLARVARLDGDAATAIARAQQATDIAENHGFRALKAWMRTELGLALLSQGDVQAAEMETERAVILVGESNEDWIGTEEVHLARARVLDALGRQDAAQTHVERAEAIIQAKADRIPDPELRRRYLRWAHRASQPLPESHAKPQSPQRKGP